MSGHVVVIYGLPRKQGETRENRRLHGVIVCNTTWIQIVLCIFECLSKAADLTD